MSVSVSFLAGLSGCVDQFEREGFADAVAKVACAT
jgi:hypothetical protein